MVTSSFITAEDLYYKSTIESIKKTDNHLQPVFEAFTNSLESINLLNRTEDKGKIIIRLFYSSTLVQEKQTFLCLEIEDTGIGFDNVNYKRFKTYKDSRKGFKNKGSGRIQLLHFFDECNFTSVFIEDEKYYQRKFSISKSKKYIQNNAIIKDKGVEEIGRNTLFTIVKMERLLVENDQRFYDDLSIENLKDRIIAHYMMYFCTHRNNIPEMIFEKYVDDKIHDNQSILPIDIPNYLKEDEIKVHYSYFSEDKKSILKSGENEVFNIKSFVIDKNKLADNNIKVTSKDEIVENVNLNLEALSKKDSIDGNRYLFLLSGDYIDRKNINENRDELDIISLEEFKKKHQRDDNLFQHKEILLDDISRKANEKIFDLHSEIKKNKEQKEKEIEKLQSMFLLNKDTLKSIDINYNDSEEKILEKVYSEDAKMLAKHDAIIKRHIESLENLIPTEEGYEESFEQIVVELVKKIPKQNKEALTHYVARRKLVLDLFEKIQDKKLEIQNETKRNIDEKLLHSLIFQQGSNNADKSDLWLVNEDFIYFDGTSESQLKDVLIDGEKLIKEKLSSEEQEFRLSLGEDRLQKRPDILLFPEESKCIIIEFKNPDVNVSDHLMQINNYASLIRNLSNPKFEFNTFYGYLIGQKIDEKDIRGHDGDFQFAYHFDYLFRPHKVIAGMFGQKDASLYTEVIKYSVLLERAKRRNKIFIDKITKIDQPLEKVSKDVV